MRKTLFFMLLSALFFLNKPLSAEVHTTNAIQSIMKEVDADTLVIFDIDQTLIYPEHNLGLDTPLAVSYYNSIAKHSSISKEKYQELYSRVYQQLPFIFVEGEKTEKVVNELKNKGIKAIALTAREGGKVGVIENAKELTFNHLSNLDVDFSHSFQEGLLTMNEFQGQAHAPFYEKGVIFAAGHEKGLCLPPS